MTTGYSRVSTRGREPGYQIRAIEAQGCENIFTDQCSGRWGSRPQLDEALGSMRKDNTLVAWKFDRLTRSLTHLIDLASEWERRECQLMSLTDAVYTSSPDGRLVSTIFGAKARFEVDLARERTAEAQRPLRATGRHLGRPSPFHDEANVRAAQALLADPVVPEAEVARRLGVSRTSPYRSFPGGKPDAFTGHLERRPA